MSICAASIRAQPMPLHRCLSQPARSLLVKFPALKTLRKTARRKAFTGKIRAVPNPPPPQPQSPVFISWETNDPKGAEVRVYCADAEQLVTRAGQTGEVEIGWIDG